MYQRHFVHEFRDAVRDARIPASHKLLLLLMSTYCNSEGGSVFPSQVALARQTGSCERTVRRHLEHLKLAGWVELAKRGRSGAEGRGARAANEYRMRIGREFALVNGRVRPVEDVQDTAARAMAKPKPKLAPVVTARPAASRAARPTARPTPRPAARPAVWPTARPGPRRGSVIDIANTLDDF